jgi:hypothetical protein
LISGEEGRRGKKAVNNSEFMRSKTSLRKI